MKLIHSHMVPGGSVKIYQEGKTNKVGRISVDLTAESMSESNVLDELAGNLTLIAEAIKKISEKISDKRMMERLLAEDQKKAVMEQALTLEQKRQAFLSNLKPKSASQADEQEHPYLNEAD